MDIDDIKRAFSRCEDFAVNSVGEMHVCFIIGVTNREYITRQIIAPLLEGCRVEMLPAAAKAKVKDIEDACDRLLHGEALVVCGTEVIAVGAQDEQSRDIGVADSDVTVKGPKAAFTENIATNLAMLRRYIRTPRLKSMPFEVGAETHTRVSVCYIEGRASERVVSQIVKRLREIKPTVIVDSGSLAPLITGDGGYPFLSLLGSTEKVDKVASKLVSGRVAILVDGSPFVLTAPYVFAESLQSAEDYLRSTWYATFIRLLRLTALLVSVFLPAIYLCVNRGKQTFFDVITTLLIFELLREVGVRMPRTVGDAVGIVGSLIIGDAAVQAGLTTDESIIVIALSAVCAFIVPAYMYSVTLTRLAFALVAFFAGGEGVAVAFALLLGLMCGIESFGSHYMSPMAPIDPKGLTDFIISVPSKALGRRERP